MRDSLPYQNSVVSLGGPRLHADDARRDRQDDLVLLAVGVMRAEQLPRTGMSPSPGMVLAVRVSESWISPARICVSPSFSRSNVLALRVPIS